MYKKSRGGSLPRISFQENLRRPAKNMQPPVMKVDRAASKMIERMSRLLNSPSTSPSQRDRAVP